MRINLSASAGVAAMGADTVMTDHLAWRRDTDGHAIRAVRMGSSVWALTVTPNSHGSQTTARLLRGAGQSPPVIDVVNPSTLAGPDVLVVPLRGMGQVARWRNPDAWDALATAVVRQVIRAEHARRLYHVFSESYGEHVATDHADTWLFPTPETVLELPDAEFSRLGLAFKRTGLRAAAKAVVEFGGTWAGLADRDPRDLVRAMQGVRRIGPWSAGAAVADLTNDYALYPYADLAVRTWAARIAPDRTWPVGEAEFAREWARLAKDQLSDLTLLTLAWGVHRVQAASSGLAP